MRGAVDGDEAGGIGGEEHYGDLVGDAVEDLLSGGVHHCQALSCRMIHHEARTFLADFHAIGSEICNARSRNVDDIRWAGLAEGIARRHMIVVPKFVGEDIGGAGLGQRLGIHRLTVAVEVVPLQLEVAMHHGAEGDIVDEEGETVGRGGSMSHGKETCSGRQVEGDLRPLFGCLSAHTVEFHETLTIDGRRGVRNQNFKVVSIALHTLHPHRHGLGFGIEHGRNQPVVGVIFLGDERNEALFARMRSPVGIVTVFVDVGTDGLGVEDDVSLRFAAVGPSIAEVCRSHMVDIRQCPFADISDGEGGVGLEVVGLGGHVLGIGSLPSEDYVAPVKVGSETGGCREIDLLHLYGHNGCLVVGLVLVLFKVHHGKVFHAVAEALVGHLLEDVVAALVGEEGHPVEGLHLPLVAVEVDGESAGTYGLCAAVRHLDGHLVFLSHLHASGQGDVRSLEVVVEDVAEDDAVDVGADQSVV